MTREISSLALFIFLIFSTLSYSQKDPIKFGKVSDEEMKMTIYDKDTSASAVVLVNYGTINFFYLDQSGFNLDLTVHKRIKILTKEGLDQANVNFTLYDSKSGDDEDVISFKAQTYNLENGKQVISKISKKEVFTEQKSENVISKNFALTNVKVGSVIEYEYTIRSPYFWSIDPWYFQDEIPTITSELRIKIPQYFTFKKVFGGYVTPSISEDGASSAMFPGSTESYTIETYRWVYQDIPAFKVEEYITTPNDYLAKVEFELQSTQVPGVEYKNYLTTWEKLGKDLMESDNFGKALDRHGMVKELTDLINPNDSVEKKIEMAYNLIRQNMKWDDTYGRIFIDNSLKSVSTKKQGSMAEVNLLLVNLLRSVGVEAYPVLISSRSHGRINQFYPRINSFNTVVALAKVKGKNVLMDATIAYLKPGQLTFNSLNGKGLMVSKDRVEWVPLLSSEQYSSASMVTVEIKDAKISAKLVRSTKSLEALAKRQKIASDGREKYIENYKKKNSSWEISDYTIENDNNSNESLLEKITIDNFNNIDVSGDLIYLPSVLTDEVEENPFSSEKREYPIDFTVPRVEKTIFNIAIPEGYLVDELPKAISVTLPENAASFSYQVQQVGKNIQIVCQLKITRTRYLPAEYELLKEFYKNIIAKYGEQIVLKKIV